MSKKFDGGEKISLNFFLSTSSSICGYGMPRVNVGLALIFEDGVNV
jgi:hypothetical protein